MAEIEDDDGMDEAFSDLSKEVAKEAANRWFSAANERLVEFGDRLDYDVSSVSQSGVPPQWDEQEGAWLFGFTHVAAVYFEFGTAPHEIEGDPILAFEWEEMRGEEFADTGKTFEEVFDEFPTVFLPATQVSGIERIGYVAHGQREAARWLREQET